MKRTLRLIAALLLLAMFTMACNQYVCPAYTKEKEKEQSDVKKS